MESKTYSNNMSVKQHLVSIFYEKSAFTHILIKVSPKIISNEKSLY